MAEVPEHLLKRAAERKAALEAKKQAEAEAAGGGAEAVAPAAAAVAGGPSPEEVAASNADAEKTGKIPAHLLARSQAAKAKAAGAAGGEGEGAAAGGGGTLTTTAPATGAAAAARVAGAAPGPGLVGPAGHTQRLLTVVKAGSIQDVRSTPTDKVNVWPHLLVVEFVASLAMTAFLLVFSTFVNAPLLGQANYNLTPNPSKAPWYFLGLQELLTLFHPMVAGVMIPGMGLVALGAAGYVDKNPSNKPEDRKYAIAIFTLFMMFWAVLVIVGSVFRGEGQNFIYPWRQGVHEIFDL
jgi:menaquinol-cytochrome c reductase cytochrome b/c subunit